MASGLLNSLLEVPHNPVISWRAKLKSRLGCFLREDVTTNVPELVDEVAARGELLITKTEVVTWSGITDEG